MLFYRFGKMWVFRIFQRDTPSTVIDWILANAAIAVGSASRYVAVIRLAGDLAAQPFVSEAQFH
jgi:hypothetical protein